MENYKDVYNEKVKDLTTELVLNLTSIEGEIIKEYEDENIIYTFKKSYKNLFKIEIVESIVTITVYKDKDESLTVLVSQEAHRNVKDLVNVLEEKCKSQDLIPTIKNIDDMINVLALNLLN